MVFATLIAQLELALKGTSVKEYAPLALGLIMEDVIVTALPNTPPLMLVLLAALQELH